MAGINISEKFIVLIYTLKAISGGADGIRTHETLSGLLP